MPEPQTLLTGIAFGESPRWHDDRLWFSDWGTQEVVAVDLEGKSEVVRMPAFAFCIDFLPHGRLLIVSARDRLLLRREPDGSLVTHADLSGLSGRPWNDIVVDGRGNAYVGNIAFDFPEGEFAPGILALVAPDGSAGSGGRRIPQRHGRDARQLDADSGRVLRQQPHGVRRSGRRRPADRRVWAELDDGVPDDICLDAEGAVWYGDVPNRRCVRVREGGEVLQTIELDRGCFACMLGGPDGKTLFLVARERGGLESTAEKERTGQVLTVPAPAPGAG